MISWIQGVDWKVLDGIQHTFACGFLDALMPWITRLGNGGAIWILAAVLLLFRKKYRRNGILLLCGLLCGVLIGNVVLKHLVARPRPCWLRPEFQLLLAVPKDFSFPSGHTLSSVIAVGCLARTDRRLGAVAIPLAALIAFSRLYLFVHFPSDVLASVVLGAGIVWGMERLFKAIWKRLPSAEN